MEVTAPDKLKPQLWIYLLISCVLILPASLFVFLVLNPYGLIKPYQQMIPAGLVLLVGLFILSCMIIVFKTRNVWSVLGIGGLLLLSIGLSVRLNDFYAMLILLVCVSNFVFLFVAIAVVIFGIQVWKAFRKQANQLPKWWYFLIIYVTFALTLFSIVSYVILGYEVRESERLSDRSYYLVGDYNFSHIALFRCNTRATFCRRIYFSGVKSALSAYHLNVRGETLEFSIGSSVILTEALNASD